MEVPPSVLLCNTRSPLVFEHILSFWSAVMTVGGRVVVFHRKMSLSWLLVFSYFSVCFYSQFLCSPKNVQVKIQEAFLGSDTLLTILSWTKPGAHRR